MIDSKWSGREPSDLRELLGHVFDRAEIAPKASEAAGVRYSGHQLCGSAATHPGLDDRKFDPKHITERSTQHCRSPGIRRSEAHDSCGTSGVNANRIVRSATDDGAPGAVNGRPHLGREAANI
jgi:hypothetical protein